MNNSFETDILNNEELKEKITKVQSKKEFLELLKEYSIQLSKEEENVLELGYERINDDILDSVSGGLDPFKLIYEHMYTFLICPCGHHENRQGFWLAMDVECSKCHKETLHGKQIFFR